MVKRVMLSFFIITMVSGVCFGAEGHPKESYTVKLVYNPEILEVGFINKALPGFDYEVQPADDSDPMILDPDMSTYRGITKADTDCHVYWKAKTQGNTVAVSMTAAPLENSSSESIDYTVSLHDETNGDVTHSFRTDGAGITFSSDNGLTEYGSYRVSVLTDSFLGKPLTDYNGSITVSIVSNPQGGTI